MRHNIFAYSVDQVIWGGGVFSISSKGWYSSLGFQMLIFKTNPY